MDKPSRPVRNRKRSRKAWPPGDTHRPVKRLFTPEIKRMLKDWLVRRRENPYPNRDEKKLLAHETGLTYTQICNWFANWRRKLKNSGNDPPTRKTWGNLIKNYNTNARGNVEQFSICSSDSIWGEQGPDDDSRGSLSPASGSGEDDHLQQQQQIAGAGLPDSLHHPAGMVAAFGGPVAFLNYHQPRRGASMYGKGYETPGYGYEAPPSGHNNNNNSEACRESNVYVSDSSGRFVDYVRLPEFGQLNDRIGENPPSPKEDPRETYPAATFCFDHCYTPRNYETVFGIPEETRCYKVTQIDGKYVPDPETTLEPLILTTATAYASRPYGKELHSNGTLYLTPTTTLAPAVAATAPLAPGGRSSNHRSSKYKNSIMEKYLRDLGELREPLPPPPPPLPEPDAQAELMPAVIMAAIPFQQAHYHHHHHAHEATPGTPGSLGCETTVLRGPPSLSKWLESTAKFTPSKHNYIDWDSSGKSQSAAKKRCDSGGTYFGLSSSSSGTGTFSSATSSSSYSSQGAEPAGHQKDEIDAAEALTRLANNFRTKFTA